MGKLKMEATFVEGFAKDDSRDMGGLEVEEVLIGGDTTTGDEIEVGPA